MWIPRTLMRSFYSHLIKNYLPTSPPVVVLVSLDPDALCACHILTTLFKRDLIRHHVQPISGYRGLAEAGENFVRPMRTTEGGSGGVVVCLGLGGLVDLEDQLGLEGVESNNGDYGNVEIWVLDARRPWNLSNVFGTPDYELHGTEGAVVARKGIERGRISEAYVPGRGGIVVFDDGDIDAYLSKEAEAYCELADMPELGEDEGESEDGVSESEHGGDEETIPESAQVTRKRKSYDEETESEADEGTPRKRRRSNTVSMSALTTRTSFAHAL